MLKFKHLSILPENKTVTIYSPVQIDKQFVRTGTIGEGSCLIHSILHAISSKYVKKNIKDRMEYVKDIRKTFGSVPKEKWEQSCGGIVALISFQETLLSFIQAFYFTIYSISPTISASEIEKNIHNVYLKKIIISLIDSTSIPECKNLIQKLPVQAAFEKNILPLSYAASSEHIGSCKDEILRQTITYYKKNVSTGTIEEENLLKTFIGYLLESSYSFAYDIYIKKIINTGSHIDSSSIGFLSDFFDRDLYFFYADKRMPYRGMGDENIKGRKSLIILWVGNCHYEIMGELLPGNKITRDFESDHPVIKKIHTYLYFPEKVIAEYSDLVAYLPKEFIHK